MNSNPCKIFPFNYPLKCMQGCCGVSIAELAYREGSIAYIFSIEIMQILLRHFPPISKLQNTLHNTNLHYVCVNM